MAGSSNPERSPLARILADFAASGAVHECSEAVLARVRTHVFDTLAAAYAGSLAPSTAPLLAVVAPTAGGAKATVLGHGYGFAPADAALVNGAQAHALELDDDHRLAVLHPGAVVVPAAFAAAEAVGASGRAFLRGVLVGYEVACRTGEVFGGSQFHHAIHPTAACGVFGAAAAAATVYGLDADITTHALGIAGTQACGLTEWRADGSWIKRLHPGRAAQSGVLAALLARGGFTGPATVFEGPGGFFRAFSQGQDLDIDALTRDLGSDWSALRTAIKPYPCCRFSHGAVDLAIEAHQQGLMARGIDRVEVRLFRTGVLTYGQRPRNAVDAQFNVPWVVAVALARGALDLEDMAESAIHDRSLLDLCARIDVVEDPAFSTAYPEHYRTELIVHSRDGSTSHLSSPCPSGDPESPRYRDDPELLDREARDKAIALLEDCAPPGHAQALVDAVADIGHEDNVGGLARLLAEPALERSQRTPAAVAASVIARGTTQSRPG